MTLELKLKKNKLELEMINEELQTLPSGRLAKNGKFYCHEINDKRVGITRNTELIHRLCRKKYLLDRIKILNSNISSISSHKEQSGVYEGIPDTYFYHPSVKDWIKQEYRKNPYMPENRIYISNNGIALRSKSELLIANLLEEHNIPYRYDAELKLDNRTIYPDFTIKKPYIGEIIIWEHFGSLHQPEYEKKMNDKMNLYLKNGYIPFETLIYTFEFDIQNTHRLKDLIDNIVV